DPELTGMLVEALASSRASSMDPQALFKALSASHPSRFGSLAIGPAAKSKKEWLTTIRACLDAGHARCGMFEKIDSSAEEAESAADGRWFYVSERDDDRERASVVGAIYEPRQKRSETKKYKQYYWKPLDKISKWDPEDEL
ncbi:hypothetical protein CONPUDRAFT_52376, partial [Coniophora puteana RWD-64-598 SS2]